VDFIYETKNIFIIVMVNIIAALKFLIY